MSGGKRQGRGGVRIVTVIAVDIGGTKLLAAAVDRSYKVISSRSSVTPADAEALIAGVESMAKDIAGQLGLRAYGLGVAVAGLVDGVTGTVLVSPNLPLSGINLKKELEARLLVPTTVDNDASLAALGELACGAAKGLKDVVALTLGTGIGGGIVVNGKLYRGALGTAAEIGHMVVEVGGARCSCGRRGCLEAFASGTAVQARARALADEFPDSPIAVAVREGALSGERLAGIARAGDAQAADIYRQAGAYLGIGIGNLVNILAPGKIILGGGMAAAVDLMMPSVKAAMLETAIDPRSHEIEIAVSTLGNQAGLMGAAAFVRELLGAIT